MGVTSPGRESLGVLSPIVNDKRIDHPINRVFIKKTPKGVNKEADSLLNTVRVQLVT